METIARRVLPFPGNGKQNHKVDINHYPDTVSLALALQTTLDIEMQLQILFDEISSYIIINGASYIHKELKLNHRINDIARHSCSYNLDLMGHSLGTLEFSRTNRFDENQLEIIEYLLSATLYPLNNAINYQKALKLAQRDPLTGISNRLSMNKTLEREINRALRYDLPLSMLVIDLDLFKTVNDNYGHSSGDMVLQKTAKIIEAALRLSDQAFRFGGEEFVVLLTDTDLKAAQIVAERIREDIANTAVSNNDAEIKFTASIGIAELGCDESQQKLFDHADNALYQAKADGRNRIVVWNEHLKG